MRSSWSGRSARGASRSSRLPLGYTSSTRSSRRLAERSGGLAGRFWKHPRTPRAHTSPSRAFTGNARTSARSPTCSRRCRPCGSAARTSTCWSPPKTAAARSRFARRFDARYRTQRWRASRASRTWRRTWTGWNSRWCPRSCWSSRARRGYSPGRWDTRVTKRAPSWEQTAYHQSHTRDGESVPGMDGDRRRRARRSMRFAAPRGTPAWKTFRPRVKTRKTMSVRVIKTLWDSVRARSRRRMCSTRRCRRCGRSFGAARTAPGGSAMPCARGDATRRATRAHAYAARVSRPYAWPTRPSWASKAWTWTASVRIIPRIPFRRKRRRTRRWRRSRRRSSRR